MSYNSIHEYLDHVFADSSNPSTEEIIAAKKQYWRQYLNHYQQKRRSRIKEYTLGFDAEKMQCIHRKRGGLSVSEFLYHCVFSALESDKTIDTGQLNTICNQQQEIIGLLEEIIDNDATEMTASLLDKMEVLEVQLLQLK
ncbi:hypothetical protein [Winogradskyella haliclonae]|uniref:DUF2383 domain-containing protein n=1 Tax=Winogradskyella haliclonae TaxID=2048558 RepID=A0ABQ2C1M7_9FLAO|nr:hypothetical protein [Winogradskyella haliclonae]GGI58466.1 hypothetical protein GCM10011444_27750 [Winogradskyella haliclonae]